MSFTQTHAFAATGADLRARAASGCPVATAEIARRSQKAPKTVAALRSRGLVAEAAARVAAAQKPAAVFARVEPSPTVMRKLRTKGVMSAMLQSLKEGALGTPAAFKRVEPAAEVEVAAPKRDSLKAVRTDMAAMDAKLDKVLGAVETLSRTVSGLYLR